MKIFNVAAAASLLCLPVAAQAGELFGGVYAHAVKTPLSLNADREGGVDFSVGLRGDGVAGLPVQPYVYGTVNSDGGTNFLAAGLSAKLGGRLYVRPGIGLAVHDGSASRVDLPDRLALGSRVLFAPELAIGTQINDRLSIEASWLHFSQGQLFGRQNPGLDSIGVRMNLRL